MRLAEKEENLLEKELVHEQVTRLSDRAKKRAETGKDDTLDLAKKVSNHNATDDQRPIPETAD